MELFDPYFCNFLFMMISILKILLRKYLSFRTNSKPFIWHSRSQESEVNFEEMFNSERSETERGMNKPEPEPEPERSFEYESLSAIWYQKFKFRLLSQNVFIEGLLPFLSWLLIESPLRVEGSKSRVTNEIWSFYTESLKYNIYVLELPYLCENLTFEAAAQKINELECHPSFISSNTRIRLIGLLEESCTDSEISNSEPEWKAFYAPFRKMIERDMHKGIYFWNNAKIKNWMSKK